MGEKGNVDAEAASVAQRAVEMASDLASTASAKAVDLSVEAGAAGLLARSQDDRDADPLAEDDLPGASEGGTDRS